MQPIFLIGFMGSGKSTLGKAIAARSELQFIDLDQYIERRFHANIRDIFAQRGEEGFRDIERRMLSEVSQFEDVVIACGGGTPCFFDNMEIMNTSGVTVFLEASEERLLQRLKLGRTRRPLIASLSDQELLDFLRSSLNARMAHYGKAVFRFNSDRLDDRSQIDHTTSEFLQRFNIPAK